MSNYLNLDVGTPNMYYNEDSQENTPTQQSTSDALYITSNLNTFYDRMYGYYYQGGIRNIMLNIGLNISILITTNLFILYTFAYINWNDIVLNCKHNQDTCQNISDFIDYSNSVHPMIILYLIMTSGYTLIYLYIHLNALADYRYISNFYKTILNIDSEYLNIIKWENVIDKIKTVQDQNKVMIERHDTSKEINQHSIIGRITQYHNIIISIVNNNILFKGTSISRNILFTQYIENIASLFIFSTIIDTNNRLIPKEEQVQKIKKHILKVILVDIIFLPFIFMFMMTYYVLKNSKDINNKESMFLNKRWTNYAKWTFKAYNEVNIDFEERMHKSYNYMNQYTNCFPSKAMNCIFYFLRFLLGTFLLFILCISFIDEGALLELKFMDFNLLWYFAILTIMTTALNNLLKNDSYKYSKDEVVKNLAKYTYELPPNDVVHNYKMYKNYIKHYKTNIENILYEITSILLSPYILYNNYYQNAEDILNYVEHNTTYIEKIGSVDNYSNFEKDMNNDNIVLYRKREKSFVAFKEIYPNWKLEANDLKNYISELSKYDNGNEFPSMYASEIFSTSYSEL